jgi:hypothetical protein
LLIAQGRPIGLSSRPGGRSGGIASGIGGRLGNLRSGGGGGQSVDSLEHRDKYEDSVTISFQFPFSLLPNKLDSSINDFAKRFPIPAHHIFLGNTGTATRSILFSPNMNSGWDAGFHAFDVYRFKPESVRFFNTTRPYTELVYLLGGRTEQIIEVTHTQNIKPNWNASFQYRLINSPGYFKSQKTNHNSYIFTSWFQSIKKRYNNYFSIVGNANQSEENGGLKSDKDYLNDPIYNDRFNVPSELGGDVVFGRNFFSSTLNTGHRYADLTLTMTQQYDLGKKDSLVSDSTVIPLFYPRLRFEHTFRLSNYKYIYIDNLADSTYYKDYFNIPVANFNDSVKIQDKWKEIVNDFSIYQYPDTRNLLQYIKAGITLQNLKGEFNSTSENFYNLFAHGEYRNKTKNKKWDMSVAGSLYINGFNSGDYQASVDLKKYAGKKQAYVELGFRNVNRTPSFIFNSRSSFYTDVAKNFKKENITNLSASFFQPALNLKISGNYFLVSNYTYFKNYYKAEQNEALFNLLVLSLEKKIRLGKHWVWNADFYLQKKTGDAPVNVPLIFSRNRIGYEGSLGFKKLNIAMGLEIKYHSPYKADDYSSPSGAFFYQDSVQINNRPDISAYLHFRIRNFRAFIRAENLNTATLTNGFGFRYHNYAAPDYPYPGMVIRIGVYWNFVN